jgi:hypothetical protein
MLPPAVRLAVLVAACAALLAGLGGCRSSTPAAEEAPGASATEQGGGVRADAGTVAPTPPPPLAPGTVRLAARVVQCTLDADPPACTLRVRRVEGYGAATTPVPTSTPLQAVVAPPQQPTAADWQRGAAVTVTLLERPGPTTRPSADAPALRWTLVAVH